MLHSTGFDCLLNAFFAANLTASDDSTGTKAISLMKKIFDFNKKNFIEKYKLNLKESYPFNSAIFFLILEHSNISIKLRRKFLKNKSFFNICGVMKKYET
ncbi:hypothetical protein BpHYR1_045995 [Brachionus plicatilis]|uniref:Uncharacterized protein n=1 Tax=Brachionus plicatilis TaxID=10195 RepID=A0A3M7SHX9_BRAPC|nr:hypothetical protein BpHYR1_045995 [Brachionus plicatilis]